ncbi:F-BAR domain only protein 2 isoform X2 [Agrilus planipennis]|uniref:F-BAR domain only protein 2 isoform X2 n=2 Tax=Agrilus planipennis TaxID=224129 RepID=A0A1W4XCH1_AGRPL|nr:F-BAR domain only protein 2 isoform X2 [Agrilus planipennis]
MTVDFNDYFWGEKNNGFDVLYHNMKYGLVASKELADFFRERSNIEENNSKLFNKLAKQAGSSCMHGTFAPLWQVLKTSSEKLSSVHLETVHTVTELVKEINKYAEDLHKKHKAVKEDESGTLEAVQAIQNTTLLVQKAKDVYSQRGIELERLRKENTSSKEIEKAEAKLKKAQEDYRLYIEKYNSVKEDFEQKMSVTCNHFQDLEVAHLTQMKEFLNSYSQVVQWTHEKIGQVHVEFKRQCLELTVDRLLEQFVLSKYTGLEKPGLVDMVEPVSSPTQEGSTNETTKPSKREGNQHESGILMAQAMPTHAKTSRRTTSLLNLFMSNSQGLREGRTGPCSAPSSPTNPTENQQLSNRVQRGSKWFLRSRRDKAKQKKTKKKRENSDNKEERSDIEEKEEAPSKKGIEKLTEVDSEKSSAQAEEESNTILENPVPNWMNDKGNFYSSSDSDSEDEREQKIRVEIKPLNNGAAPMSASVDELRATVENLYLSPSSNIRRNSNSDEQNVIKRSQSVSQQLGKPTSSDLLGINLFQSQNASNASTPGSSHPYAPLQSPSQPNFNSPTFTSSSRYSDLKDLFNEGGGGSASESQLQSSKISRHTPTPTSGIISIPRPPSRRSEASSRILSTSSTISRADSLGSLEFRTAGISSVNVSRGPSPLTIGMADTIPLAVAFHEIIHSFFRGSDETKCQVKMSGEMMLSFPAGIVIVLANNPNPAKLAFQVRNTQKLSNILPNKKLVSLDNTQSSTDNLYIEFNMPALSSLLKSQSEQNPNASYFNVEILKYQIKPKPGANSCPFQLVAYWKCDLTQSNLKIDYKYNSRAVNSALPLLNLMVAVPLSGGVKNFHTKPVAQWNSEQSCLIWKFAELSQHSENNGVGSLRARIELEKGPGTPPVISAQFNCEGTTLSGIDFQLIGTGYRLSLVKRRFISGKYICNSDSKFNSEKSPSSSLANADC